MNDVTIREKARRIRAADCGSRTGASMQKPGADTQVETGRHLKSVQTKSACLAQTKVQLKEN